MLVVLVPQQLEFLLEGLELALEAGVRVNHTSRLPHSQNGRVVGQRQLVHEEGDDDSGRSRDTGPAAVKEEKRG